MIIRHIRCLSCRHALFDEHQVTRRVIHMTYLTRGETAFRLVGSEHIFGPLLHTKKLKKGIYKGYKVFSPCTYLNDIWIIMVTSSDVHKWPMTQSFNAFREVSMSKLVRKQQSDPRYETPWYAWHCNDTWKANHRNSYEAVCCWLYLIICDYRSVVVFHPAAHVYTMATTMEVTRAEKAHVFSSQLH